MAAGAASGAGTGTNSDTSQRLLNGGAVGGDGSAVPRPITAPVVGSGGSSGVQAVGRAVRASVGLIRRQKQGKAKSRVRMVRNTKSDSAAKLAEVGQGPGGAERERILWKSLALREVESDLEEAAWFRDAELLREGLQDAWQLGIGEEEPCVGRALETLRALEEAHDTEDYDNQDAAAANLKPPGPDPRRPRTAPSALGPGWEPEAPASTRPGTAASQTSSLPMPGGDFHLISGEGAWPSPSGNAVWDGGLSRPSTAASLAWAAQQPGRAFSPWSGGGGPRPMRAPKMGTDLAEESPGARAGADSAGSSAHGGSAFVGAGLRSSLLAAATQVAAALKSSSPGDQPGTAPAASRPHGSGSGSEDESSQLAASVLDVLNLLGISEGGGSGAGSLVRKPANRAAGAGASGSHAVPRMPSAKAKVRGISALGGGGLSPDVRA